MKYDAPGIVLSNASATSSNFQLSGGRYGVTVMATGYALATNYLSLQILAADGSTWLDLKQVAGDDLPPTAGLEVDIIIGRWDANGMKVFNLPAGVYRFTETGALTAIYAAVARADF